MSATNTEQEANPTPPPTIQKGTCVNILCMHGKGNDGPSFQSLTTPLQEALATRMQNVDSLTIQWKFLSAPFPMRVESEGSTTTNDKQKREWWRLLPNTRSFNAKEYIGFEESESLVLNALVELEQEQAQTYDKNLDLVLGHSQGAILVAALLAQHAQDLERTTRGFILNGCAWPNPYTRQLESFQSKSPSLSSSSLSLDDTGMSQKALFIIGEADSINPPEGAKQVRDCLQHGGMDVETVYHEGGHAIPVRNEAAVKDIVDWMEGWIQSHL